MTLSDVISGGDRRASLVAIRDHLALKLEEAEGREVAAIAKQLADVIRELDSLPDARRESTVADLSARIARRKAAAGQ